MDDAHRDMGKAHKETIIAAGKNNWMQYLSTTAYAITIVGPRGQEIQCSDRRMIGSIGSSVRAERSQAML